MVACTYCTSDHSLSSNADKFDKVTKTLKLSAMHTPPSVLKPTCSGFAFLILANQGLHTNTQMHRNILLCIEIHKYIQLAVFSLGTFGVFSDLFLVYKWRASVCSRGPTDCFQILTEQLKTWDSPKCKDDDA